MIRHPRDTGPKPRSGQAENDRPRTPRASGATSDRPQSDRPQSDRPFEKRGAGGKPSAPVRTERVAKALARAGVASRREVERLISLGLVAVNGRILDTPAVLVSRDDILTVEGEVVNGPEETRLWRYHKPTGLVTTHRDPQDRPTVFQNLPEELPRVISVGRLDLNSEGLLLLTNDGALARALELPSSGWRRTYRARALGHATQEKLDRLKDGITVEGVTYGAIEAKLDKVKEGAQGANAWITITLSEGKNREVRRVLEAIGLRVNRLIRLAYGPFQLGSLNSGDVEEVGPRVIREQLADMIAAQNMPTGDRVNTPPPEPGRRPTGTPSRASNALADPNRKPSRVRAQARQSETGEASRPDRSRPDAGRGPARPRRDDAERPARREHTGKPRAFQRGQDDPRDGPRDAPGNRPGDRSRTGPRTGPHTGRDDRKGGAFRPRDGVREDRGGYGAGRAAGGDRPRQKDSKPYGSGGGDRPRSDDRPRNADESAGARKAYPRAPFRADRDDAGSGAHRGPAGKPSGAGFKGSGFKGGGFKGGAPGGGGGYKGAAAKAGGFKTGGFKRGGESGPGERGPGSKGPQARAFGDGPRSDSGRSGHAGKPGGRPGGGYGAGPRDGPARGAGKGPPGGAGGPRSGGPRSSGPKSGGPKSGGPRSGGSRRGPPR